VTTFRQFDGDELERLRRMRECHVADRLTNEELSRAVRLLPLRRTLRSRPRAQLLRIAFATAFGSLLTLGALAATRQLKWFPPFAQVAATPQHTANPQRAAQPNSRSNANRHLQSPRAAESDSPAPPLPPPTESPGGFEPETRAPLSATPARQPQGSASAVRPHPLGSTPAAQPEHALGVNQQQQQQQQQQQRQQDQQLQEQQHAWTRAAVALRSGDRATAQLALRELSQSPDPETRDAALLAQAELDSRESDQASAHATLHRLAETGATAFVRRRARQLLNAAK
jgi:hypothetical protein